MRTINRLILLFITLIWANMALAQPKLEFDLKKSKEFEERKLPSEKLAEKKFTFLRRFFQNNYTHYNYFFNANLRLNEIINESKTQSQEDYTQLLPYYSYSLDQTSQSSFLDSVLQKCTAGILLHDLRNDWIDNMYLVMGKAFLLRKNFDSASATFQFINYSFAPKEKDGYDKYIGSNAEKGGQAFSIATKEKKGKFSYLFTRPPSRNESFVWQVRTLTEMGEYTDASSLIEILREDPLFPKRLKEELAEVRGYMYYKLESWDSSAKYLEKSIPQAPNRQEKARSWYLAGQLHQMAGQNKEASEAYAHCTNLTLDPVMEVYARLNTIRLNKSTDSKVIDANIASLVSMAKKDKYQNYRDIIYYAAALFELERNGYDPAKAFLLKSIKANETDLAQKSRSFMLLANIEFQQKNYAASAPLYDSVDENSLAKESALLLTQRKPATHHIYEAVQIIYLQDSLLRISDMEEAKRMDYVKQVSRRLRKERGLKEDPLNTGSGSGNVPLNNPAQQGNTASSLFTSSPANWYFYDVGIRASGFTKFKDRWGSRPNQDNWRRSSAISKTAVVSPGQDVDIPVATNGGSSETDNFDSTDISFDNLYSRIPISEENRLKANNKINEALFKEGTALHEELEDYEEAIKVFEYLLSRQDTGEIAEKSLYALLHCYSKTGDIANANRCRQLLQKQFKGSDLSEKLNKEKTSVEVAKTDEATKTYKKIYDLFIEGNFIEALEQKQKADSTLGNNYWTPQLLYIESVYFIHHREDSLAINELRNIETQFATHPLAARATKLIEVLGRRKEIEAYLTKLEVTRAKEEEIVVTRPLARLTSVSTVATDSSQAPKTTVSKPAVDTIPTLVVTTPTEVSPYLINPDKPFIVAMVLDKVDPAYVNEVLYSFNTNSRKNFNGRTVEASKKKLRDDLWVVILKSAEFSNASQSIDYISYLKPLAAKDIIPWLDQSKYNFIIISEENFNMLIQDPKMELYQKVLKQTLPGRF